MSNFSHNPLQYSIYQLLKNDAALAAMITDVFDRAGQGTQFPYVLLGDAECADWSSKTTNGTEQHSTIHIWSREGGRKEVASIMERVHTLLHDASLSVTGHTLILIRFAGSSITLEKDGWTYHGIMHFRSLLQAQ